MNSQQRETLLKLISDACTNEQISGLLRHAKEGNKKVRVSGSSAELIGHLRDARDENAVTDDDLVGLLSAGEENGRQHIFLYRVAPNASSRLSDPRRAHAAFLERNGIAETALPRLALEPVERTIADVRLDKLANDQELLVVKTYSGRYVEHLTEREPFTRGGQQYIRRVSRVEYDRLVSTVRLHPRGLLEIRVPNGQHESRRQCLADLEELRTLILPSASSNAFLELDLTKAMKALVAGHAKNGCDYRIDAVQAHDAGAPAEFGSPMEGQDLFSSQRHEAAISQYKDFLRLDAYFKSPLLADPPRPDVRCQLAVYKHHGVRLGARLEPDEVDLIVNRLWRLAA